MILAIAVSRKWVRQGPDYNDLKSNGKADYLEVTERERELMVIWTMMSQRGGDEKCYQKLLEDIILMGGQNGESKVFIEKQNQ